MKTVIAQESLESTPQQSAIQLNRKKSLWKVIAKNELKVRTSFVRNYRGIFFGVLYGLFLFWALLGAPLLFEAMLSPIYRVLPIDVQTLKIGVGITIETLMMSMFLILLMYPLNTVYRRTEIGFQETLLASPASAKDIFLGQFLGKMPFYGLFILGVAPIVAGIVGPLIELTPYQYGAIYLSVFGMIFFANLIGSVLSAWIERKMMRSEKARDWGRAMLMVLSIVLVIIMYSIIFFLGEIMKNLTLRNWLMFYPSMWYSNIILYAIEPSLISNYVLDIWMSSFIAIIIPIVLLYVSYQRADSFYTLEGGIEKISSSAILKENIFYRMIRVLTGRKWGGLIATQLKAFMRKKENFARIGYAAGLVIFFSWFYSSTFDQFDAEDLVMSQTMLIITGGLIFSLMIGSLVFVDSKDLLWVYKRSPRGVEGLVYSYLFATMILAAITDIIISTAVAIFFQLDFWGGLFFFIMLFIYTLVVMMQTIGINCFSPVYESKGGKLFANSQISLVIQMVFLFLTIFVFIGLIINSASLLEVRLIIYGPLILMNIAVAIPLFYFGLKRLNKME